MSTTIILPETHCSFSRNTDGGTTLLRLSLFSMRATEQCSYGMHYAETRRGAPISSQGYETIYGVSTAYISDYMVELTRTNKALMLLGIVLIALCVQSYPIVQYSTA